MKPTETVSSTIEQGIRKGFQEAVFVIGRRHMYSTERFILFDTICFDVSAKAALHIIAGQLNEERDLCNSKLPESSLS